MNTLFDIPKSHKDDPVTSRIAAEKLAKNGDWNNQKERVLEALKRHPGRTSAELAEIMDVDRHLTARRLPDLLPDLRYLNSLGRQGKGFVRQGAKRYCAVRESLCVTWWPLNGE